MTDAKHEAPAETITSAELIANTDYARGAVRVPGETEDRRIYGQPEAPAEGAGEQWLWRIPGRGWVLVSEEAEVVREARVGGEWVETEVIALSSLRARSSAPEAREDALGNLLAVIHGDGGHRALEVGTKQAALEAEKIVAGLFAAPSADKLRIAVETLEPFANLGVSSGPDDEPCHYAYRITRGAIRNARQALATLKAEGGK